MQRKQRFTGDQRYDLVYFNKMLGYIEQEFQAYNELFFSPNNYVIKNWVIENAGGLVAQVNITTDSLLMNSQRDGFEDIQRRKTTDTQLQITLADNATNYVEVQMSEITCAPDIVSKWDPLANGNVGQEFSQSEDTITKQESALVNNTVAFSGDDDKLPLATVTTAGGVITNITDSRDLFFHLAVDYNFGGPRTDNNISNIKEAYDAITTAIKEMKGSANWYDVPGPTSFEFLERINFILTEGGTISWETAAADRISWSDSLKIIAPSRSYEYTILNQTVNNFLAGEVLYVTLPTFGTVPGGPLTVNKVAASSFVLSQNNFILAYRGLTSNKVYFGNGWQSVELESGEGNQLGDGITVALLTATGLTDENDSTPPYTSTNIITPSAPFTQTISELDAAVQAIQSDNDAIVGTAGQVTAGLATHTTLQAAHDAISAGQKIFILDGVNTTESSPVILSKKIRVEGKGHDSTIGGDIEIQTDYCRFDAFRIDGDIQTGTNEETRILTVADVADSLDGTFFILYDEDGDVAFWFDNNNSGTPIPAGAAAANRAVEINTVNTNDTANNVAAKVQAFIDGDSKFSATVSTNQIDVKDVDPGSRTDAVDGAVPTGFTITTPVQGTEQNGNFIIGCWQANGHDIKEVGVGNDLNIYQE